MYIYIYTLYCIQRYRDIFTCIIYRDIIFYVYSVYIYIHISIICIDDTHKYNTY